MGRNEKTMKWFVWSLNLFWMRLRIRGRVRPPVYPSVPRYFRKSKNVKSKPENVVKDMINNDTISDDEVFASNVPPWYIDCRVFFFCLSFFLLLLFFFFCLVASHFTP